MATGAHGAPPTTATKTSLDDIAAKANARKIPLSKRVFHKVCSNLGAIVFLILAVAPAKWILQLQQRGELESYLHDLVQLQVQLNMTSAAYVGGVIGLLLALYFLTRPDKNTYLLDFYCFRPPNRMKVDPKMFIDGARHNGYDESSLNFMQKILEISGLGNETYFPDKIIAGLTGPIQQTVENCREESQIGLFACVDHILKRTRLNPNQIDGLIVHCTSFNTVPSLSAMVVNKFKMRSDIRSINIAGMGCSASVIAIDIAKDMLAQNPGTRIMVCGTENLLATYYKGKQKSMLISNCIFRAGGVAYILSNVPSDVRRAKYRLDTTVRTHLGNRDEAYNAVIQREDDDGVLGVKIGKELMKVAGQALEMNIRSLGPKVLPLSEKLLFAANLVARKVVGKSVKPYMPDFKLAFEHFCIHPGGKAVIDAVGEQLGLSKRQCMPMLRPFERFGNTSSCSTWYAWSYIETEQGVAKGDRLWQLGFGSGFKCCSATWTALRNINDQHDAWRDVPSC